VEIEIENKFNKNLRERNPQTAIVEAVWDGCSQMKVGDILIIHHFIFCDGNGDPNTGHYIDGKWLYSVAEDDCFVLIRDGEIAEVLNNNVLCEALPLDTNSVIALHSSVKSIEPPCPLRVLKIGHAIADAEYAVGEVIICNPKLPYPFVFKGKQYIMARERNVLFKYGQEKTNN
jgi:hypothetical protein